MSAAGRNLDDHERIKNDAYYTPKWAIERLMERLPADTPLGGKWLEPCAGHGKIIEVVNTMCLENDIDQPEWFAVDIGSECLPSLTEVVDPFDIEIADFLVFTEGSNERIWDVSISNPPYSIAMDIIEACFRVSKCVIMLLRVSILESEDRADWMKANPPDVYVLPNRPSFAHGGTDNCAYAWMIWYPGQVREFGKLCVLDNTPLAVRKPEGRTKAKPKKLAGEVKLLAGEQPHGPEGADEKEDAP